MNRLNPIQFFSILLLTVSTIALAASPRPGSSEYRMNEKPRWALDFSAGAFNYDYKEDIEPPLKSTEKGWIPMVSISAENLIETASDAYFAGSLEVGSANTLYDGSYQNGDPAQGTTKNIIYNLEGNVGMNLSDQSESKGQILGYTGLGFHFWRRDLSGSNGGFLEDYSWWYLPAGIRYRMDNGNGTRFGIDTTAKLIFGGNTRAYLSDVSNAQDIDLPLGVSWGGKASIFVERKLTSSSRLRLSPFYEYTTLKESPVIEILTSSGQPTGLGAREPSSRTHQYGASLTLGFIL